MKTNQLINLTRICRNKTHYIFTVFFLLLTGIVNGQDPPQYGTPFGAVPDPRDINMYQVNIRAFSSGSNLTGVTARLDNIKAVGTNVIYLMPVFPVGTDSRSKVASSTSPYSIKDFKSVGAEYGTLANLRALVDGAHSRGMAVILDFVVNQTSWDHPWITQHPDWYVRDGNGNIQQLANFADVAALNMYNVNVRNAMIDALRYWVFAANIDGFRFDFANNAPIAEFWTPVLSNLRGINGRKLILFAEGDRPTNFQAGFDLNFGDKWYYDAVRPIIRDGASVANLQNTTNVEYQYATGNQQVVRYTGNHDSNGDGTPLEAHQLGSQAGVMASFVVSAYMRGVPFLYGSQEVAFPTRIPWPWDGVDINWSLNPGVTAEFAKVLNFRTSSTAIRRGAMTNYSGTNVCAFTKISGTEKVVVMVNMRNANNNFTVPSAIAGNYKDAYTGAAVTLTTGAQIALGAYQYRVLTNTGVSGGTSVTYYQIKNRWQSTSYLYDAGNGQVRYGTGPITNNYQWEKRDVGGGFFVLKNRATGNVMHVENQNGSVQATAGDPTWWSAMWSTPSTPDGWNTIQNRWQTSQVIHIEGLTGYAQYSGAQTGWYSAMWQFVNPVTVQQ